MKIIGIGDLVLDVYMNEKEIIGITSGMSFANVIYNITRLLKEDKNIEFESIIYGVCGNDIAGNIILKEAEESGIQTKYITIKDKKDTRKFYIYLDENSNFLASKKKNYITKKESWYNTSMVKKDIPEELLSKENIYVLGSVSKNFRDIMDMIEEKEGKICLDLGHIAAFRYISLSKLKEMLTRKYYIVNLNERVAKYLLTRFGYNEYKELKQIFLTDMLIITKGKEEIEIFVKDINYVLKNENINYNEKDPSGAGDLLFSHYIVANIIRENNMKTKKDIKEEIQYFTKQELEEIYNNANKEIYNLVSKLGARIGVDIKKPTEEFVKIENTEEESKEVKEKNIHKLKNAIEKLEERVESALLNYNEKSEAGLELLKDLESNKKQKYICIGSGGSSIPSEYTKTIINNTFGVDIQTMFPKEYLETNTEKYMDYLNIICFSYSGSSPEIVQLLNGKYNMAYIVTKANEEDLKISLKENNVDISKIRIISYNNESSKERGFLSIEGIIVPALIMYMLVEKKNKEDILELFKKQFEKQKEKVEKYFIKNNEGLKKAFKKNNIIDIYYDNYTKPIMCDLESKIVETGIYRCTTHEKKNFSHGRFITLEKYPSDVQIYLKLKKDTKYDDELLKYLSIYSKNLIILEPDEENNNGILELLIYSQLFIYEISKLLKKDLSNPDYSEDSMKIYRYNKEII